MQWNLLRGIVVSRPVNRWGNDMLRWALIFLVIALIAGLLGFTGIAGTSIAIAKTLFFIFIVIFLALMIAGLFVGGRLAGR